MSQKYYSSPRWSSELADCSNPMTFDTYSNCAFGCIYCFSMYWRGIGVGKDKYLNKEVRWVNPDYIKDMFSLKRQTQFSPYIKARRTLQWGGLSDQFDGYEKKYGKTLELLKIFKELDYPITFSTKATWWLKDARYTDLFRNQKNWNVKFSIITLDEDKARVIERGVPPPLERIDGIKRFAELNAGGATLRLRPFIMGISDGTYLDLITQAAKAGATALSTEFFCLETRSRLLRDKYLPIFSELAGFDLWEFYKKYSINKSGYMRLNRNLKRPYIDNMQKLCKELGMRFYVSDAHFKERCDGANCCGLPDSWNFSKANWSNALQLAKHNNGYVYYSMIENEINATYSHFNYGKAIGFNSGGVLNRSKFSNMTFAEYMHWLWNNPQSGQSPYKLFEGVLKPAGKDDNGDLIYKIDETRL